MQQSNGPTYEFFEKLLPPLRYVNAAFRHYPIVLSAPGGAVKARLVSNGSAVNALAKLNTWKETGIPVTFLVGSHGEVFGNDFRRLTGPHFEKGYLPLVHLRYEAKGSFYEEEAFAATEPQLAAHGIVFVRFVNDGKRGSQTSARIDFTNQLSVSNGAIRLANGFGRSFGLEKSGAGIRTRSRSKPPNARLC